MLPIAIEVTQKCNINFILNFFFIIILDFQLIQLKNTSKLQQ